MEKRKKNKDLIGEKNVKDQIWPKRLNFQIKYITANITVFIPRIKLVTKTLDLSFSFPIYITSDDFEEDYFTSPQFPMSDKR